MSAQTITIPSAEVCAAQEVLLPVTGASMMNVGAITLYIGFDTTLLTFISIENIDPQLMGMSTNMMTIPSQLAFAWSSTSPINFQSGTMFEVRFSAHGQTAPVFFNPGCEVSDSSGIIIPVLLTNGAVAFDLPDITIQPKDTTVTEGGQALFTVVASNTISYSWQESPDNGNTWIPLEDGGIYSGCHSPELTVSQVPLSFNNNLYQCALRSSNCLIVSEPATLLVDELTSSVFPGRPSINGLLISPVPFSRFTTVNFTMPEIGNAMIRVMNCTGQLVTEISLPSQSGGTHNIELNTSDWRPGIYFVKFTMILANRVSDQVVKIIKATD